MNPRTDNPVIYRDNVYKSWKIMAYVVSRVDDTCFVAHLEPNPGVGYDCLSLVTQDKNGGYQVRFMLNRNGTNADVLDNVWDRYDRQGCDRVATEIMKACGLSPSSNTERSATSVFCGEVVTWLEAHRNEDFCVGPIGWPGGCETFLEIEPTTTSKGDWPIPDHGPDLCLGIGGVEKVRLDQSVPMAQPLPVEVRKKSDRASAIESLALSIAHCDELSQACIDRKHPCHKIVTTQKEFGEEHRQVPEAWVGNLESAHILFLSSNPSISKPQVPGTGEKYPLANYFDTTIAHPEWPREKVIDFQVNRLDQTRPEPFVTANSQFLCVDGQYRGSDNEKGTKASQKYWKAAFKQVEDLLGTGFDLGRDICMTEIVHCKSKREQGVSKASGTCSEKFLSQMLELSGSRLVLVGGAKARAQVHAHRLQWQEGGHITWDISDHFGFLRKGGSRPSDHVGLIKIQGETKVVIATEQLSYASNTNRFVQSVIGESAFDLLTTYVRSETPVSFGSRADVLKFLGM